MFVKNGHYNLHYLKYYTYDMITFCILLRQAMQVVLLQYMGDHQTLSTSGHARLHITFSSIF